MVDQYLQDVGLYERQEDAVSREEVLGRLDQVKFVMSVSFSNIWSLEY